MILAELNVRHTRRHMPTRRVALDASYLPMNGSAHGSALLAAVVAENVLGLDEEQRDLLPKFLFDARVRASTSPASPCATGSRPTSTASTARATGCSVRTGCSSSSSTSTRPRSPGDRRGDGRRRDGPDHPAEGAPRDRGRGRAAGGHPRAVDRAAAPARRPPGAPPLAASGPVDGGTASPFRTARSGTASRPSGGGRWRCSA